jgi:hypothetical protein
MLAVLAATSLAACATAERQRESLGAELRQVFTQCAEKAQPQGYAAVARCAEGPVRRLYEARQFAYMDLVDLYLAHWISLAQKVDSGQASPEEAQLQLMEQLFRISTEAQRRDGQFESHRVLLSELRPLLPPRR